MSTVRTVCISLSERGKTADKQKSVTSYFQNKCRFKIKRNIHFFSGTGGVRHDTQKAPKSTTQNVQQFSSKYGNMEMWKSINKQAVLISFSIFVAAMIYQLSYNQI
jgi:hypothetical protein